MRYLIMVQLRADTDPDRRAQACAGIVSHIKRLAKEPHEMAYRSVCGLTFGVMFRSDTDPSELQHILPGQTFMRNGDGFIITELGELKAGHGLSRAWTWLQRHP